MSAKGPEGKKTQELREMQKVPMPSPSDALTEQTRALQPRNHGAV